MSLREQQTSSTDYSEQQEQEEEETGATKQHHQQVASNTSSKLLANNTAIAPGEHVIVLSTSTSTTGISDSFAMFQADTSYTIDLNQVFFNSIASPTGKGFLDMVKAGGKQEQDLLKAGGTELKGTKPQSLSFTITSEAAKTTTGGTVYRPTNSVPITAANNGMLNLARLASAYLTAVKGGVLASNPSKLTLACDISFGTNPKTENEDARKELVLSTVPPNFKATANSMANFLIDALIGSYGFAKDVDPTAANHALLMKTVNAGSVRAMADMAEKSINGIWHDRPKATARSFVQQDIPGIAAGIMSTIGTQLGQEADDYSIRDTRDKLWAGKSPVKGSQRTIQTDVRKKIIADAMAQTAHIKEGIFAGMTAGLTAELPAKFHGYLPTMLINWKKAVEDAIAAIDWVHWYDHLFQQNHWVQAAPSKSTVITSNQGNTEGAVKNELRLHKEEESTESQSTE